METEYFKCLDYFKVFANLLSNHGYYCNLYYMEITFLETIKTYQRIVKSICLDLLLYLELYLEQFYQ